MFQLMTEREISRVHLPGMDEVTVELDIKTDMTVDSVKYSTELQNCLEDYANIIRAYCYEVDFNDHQYWRVTYYREF